MATGADTVRQWLTFALAAWGAGLSTFTFFKSRADSQARLSVEFGVTLTQKSAQQRERAVLYGVTVNNDGQVDVHFPKCCAFIRFDAVKGSARSHDILYEPPEDAPALPRLLKPGQSFMAFLTRADFHYYVERELGAVLSATVRGGVVDAIGRRFVGKKVIIDGIDVKDRTHIGGLFDLD